MGDVARRGRNETDLNTPRPMGPWPCWRVQGRTLIGGILLGWGVMLGLGCTVGVLLSGTMAAALSGWIFGGATLATAALTLRWRWDR